MKKSISASNAAFSSSRSCPQIRKVRRLAIDFEGDTEEVLEAAVERPRIGLDVEEDVPRRWLGEGRQAAPDDRPAPAG